MEKIAFEERAVALFMKGYNCAQALYGAFAPAMGLDEKEALRLASPFGGGFGRMREVCGAFSGMMLVVGNLFGYDDVEQDNKKELYPRVQALGEEFRNKMGSLVCRELLDQKAGVGGQASERTKEYYATRPCVRIVEESAAILREYLEKEGVL